MLAFAAIPGFAATLQPASDAKSRTQASAWRVTAAPHGAVKPGAQFAVTVAGVIDPG